MVTKPDLGTKAGQQISVLKSIQNFLKMMTEGGAKVAHTVVKELLQNADDAGATEVAFFLDERTKSPTENSRFSALNDPALLVRNNAYFKCHAKYPDDTRDDFVAIREVASESKLDEVTASGKFGIGFNSVYFVTDHPVIFSRQEVNVFDLLNSIFDGNGWLYSLQECNQDASLCDVLNWCFPPEAVGVDSFKKIAQSNLDYRQTLFRFPLRKSGEGDPAVFDDRFADASARFQLFEDMIEEAARSIIFLKNVCKITFSVITDSDVQSIADIEATPTPAEFGHFLAALEKSVADDELSDRIETSFLRSVNRVRTSLDASSTKRSSSVDEKSWKFQVYHRGCFEDPELLKLRRNLKKNKERAVPWVAMAVPLTFESVNIEKSLTADWRVVLPLIEPGPSKCLFSGAFFVGPRRQKLDYRRNENDEGERRTRWNQCLVERGLVPLLQLASAEISDLAPTLIVEKPESYLQLFPSVLENEADDACLADYMRRCFARVEWTLSVSDVWNRLFEITAGGSNDGLSIEVIPEWLATYKSRFETVPTKKRYFVRYELGKILKDRLSRNSGVSIGRASYDVLGRVLRHSEPPLAKDLKPLIKNLLEQQSRASALGGVWAFVRTVDSKELRYDPRKLYIISEEDSKEPLLSHLRDLNLPTGNVEWVNADTGLAALLTGLPADVENVVKPDKTACMQLFRTLPDSNSHDLLGDAESLIPVIQFLSNQPPAHISSDLKLGFLVITDSEHIERRDLGVVLLPPKEFDIETRGLWKLWFQTEFAAIEQSCAEQIHRLLKKHATSIELMHSSDCQVIVGDWQNAIKIFTCMRFAKPEAIDTIGEVINQADDELALRVSSALLADADRQWEKLSEAEQQTVLLLPIHRRADGEYISLMSDQTNAQGDLQKHFRLQAEDNVDDAPITLPDCSLLQVPDPATKQFYKRRLGFVSHDTAFLLKEVLSQIGTRQDYPYNKKMLHYISRHAKDEFDWEYRSALRKSFADAKLVPCLDGAWRIPEQCTQVWEVFDCLTLQGWQRDSMEQLLAKLFPEENIAKLDPDLKKILPSIPGIRKITSQDIAKHAVQSPSVDLTLDERLRLIIKNPPAMGLDGLVVPDAIRHLEIPLLAGKAPLEEAEVFCDVVELATDVVQKIVPNAVDLELLADKWKVKTDDIPQVLKLFGVQRISTAKFNNRLVAQLSNIWTQVSRSQRAQLIRYLNKNNLAEQLSATDAVHAIAVSLRDFAADCALETYKLIAEICQYSAVANSDWQELSDLHPVFYNFKDVAQFYSAKQIFIGTGKYRTDLSKSLVCLKSSKSAFKDVEPFYRSLGLPQEPSVSQVVAALSSFSSPDSASDSAYLRLLDVLEDLTTDNQASIDEASLGNVKVLTCNGDYQALSSCYFDDLLGHTARVFKSNQASKLVDLSVATNKRLYSWLCKRGKVVNELRDHAQLALIKEPRVINLTPEQENLLSPWRRWFSYASRQNSALRSELLNAGFRAVESEVKLVPVDNLKIRARFADGSFVDQSNSWTGPLALLLSPTCIYVQLAPVNGVEAFDQAIIDELSRLLLSSVERAKFEGLSDKILSTLERPTTLLKQLHKKYRFHFLHQYQNEVPDPIFADLFDEYQSLDPECSEAQDLEQTMYAQLEKNYVPFRKESIRSFGYDEQSVFTELIQNAEDAYVQREALGMPLPSKGFVTFRISQDQSSNKRILDVEHGGRPFNCWQYNDKEDRNFARDVEGVLRSSGSFKPHSSLVNDGFTKTIGKFGLGFKSVFLLTDRPQIHSGEWHFAIDSGCLPREVRVVSSLPKENTMIRLPLRDGGQFPIDGKRLFGTIPFLRMITKLDLTSPEFTVGFDTTAELIFESKDVAVEWVIVQRAEASSKHAVTFLRVRDRNTDAQLALLLSSGDKPTHWDEQFGSDLYASLPLRSELKCGVAVSHAFEVQSGRTHLVDPAKNKERFIEIASLVKHLPDALTKCNRNAPAGESLTKFWTVWKWHTGDSECEVLRRCLATALADLALEQKVLPTLDDDSLLSLRDGLCFYFADLPDLLWNALVDAGVAFEVDGMKSITLKQSNVIAEGLAACYKRVCEYAQRKPPQNLIKIGWKEIEAGFQSKPWFVEKPQLLSILSQSVKGNEEHRRRISQWLGNCLVAGQTAQGKSVVSKASQLYRRGVEGLNYLPPRFINFIGEQYDEHALSLLLVSGLKLRPSDADLVRWINNNDFTTAEGICILQYLHTGDGFSVYHNRLKDLFRSAWLPFAGKRITCIEAKQKNLLPQDVLANEVLQAWLGLAGMSSATLPAQPKRPDAHQVLVKLSSWWDGNAKSLSADYERRLYPGSRAPQLSKQFNNDAVERQKWLTIFLLGVFHKMGRTQYEQHRGFLARCERKDWWSVLTDANSTAEQWMGLLHSYLDDEANPNHEDYEWVRQFVSIYHISRWLPQYARSFLELSKLSKPFDLYQVTDIRDNEYLSGTGIDAPNLRRGLGIGACFVLRELSRLGVLQQPYANPYCFVPLRRTRVFFEERLGCTSLGNLSNAADRSKEIHKFLVEHLGEERATFNGAFDLAILCFLEDQGAQLQIYGEAVLAEDNSGNTQW